MLAQMNCSAISLPVYRQFYRKSGWLFRTDDVTICDATGDSCPSGAAECRLAVFHFFITGVAG